MTVTLLFSDLSVIVARAAPGNIGRGLPRRRPAGRDAGSTSAGPAVTEASPPAFTIASLRIAAIDLGSNSFHLVIVEGRGGAFQVIDCEKEMVRLSERALSRGRLSTAATARW